MPKKHKFYYCSKLWTQLPSLQALVKHKYGAILNCKISIKFSGANDLRLLSCTFKPAGGHTNMGLMTAGMAFLELKVLHYATALNTHIVLQISMARFYMQTQFLNQLCTLHTVSVV